MYQFFVEPGQIMGNTVEILGGDVNHIKNVLRLRKGEEISVFTGADKKEYRCAISSSEEDRILCDLLFVKDADAELPVQISLLQCLPKADKMELLIRKCVELGVYSVTPVSSSRCVVKLNAKTEASKLSRWQKIAEAAAKQSKRALIPEVESVLSFREACEKVRDFDVKLIPYEMAEDMEHTRSVLEKIRPGQKIAVFIGPEGGFSPEEILFAKESGMEPITLGKRILRTETAGMTLIAWLGYLLEGKEGLPAKG